MIYATAGQFGLEEFPLQLICHFHGTPFFVLRRHSMFAASHKQEDMGDAGRNPIVCLDAGH